MRRSIKTCLAPSLVFLLLAIGVWSAPVRQSERRPSQVALLKTAARATLRGLSSTTVRSVLNPFLLFGKRDVSRQEPIEDGIIHRLEWYKSDPLLFNTLTVDLTKSYLHIETEKGHDLLFKGEKVAAIAQRDNYPGHTVVAAINGDFWGKRFMPIGLFVDDGTILKGPCPYRSVFLVDKGGKPHIARVGKMEVTIKVGRKKLPISVINPEGDADAILFTSRFGASVKFKSRCGIFLLKKLDSEFLPNQPCHVRVEGYFPDETEMPCPENGFILAVKPDAIGPFKDVLKPGCKCAIFAKLKGFDKPVVLAIGGTPRILRNGKISIEISAEHVAEGFSTTRHPRTAIGLSKDRKTLYIVTVDGRQPALSIGVSLKDLAKYLKGIGAWDALNLDGGGSTTMWVRGNVVNSPSDAAGPRTVSNALLIVSTAPRGAPAHLLLEPKTLRIPPQTRIPLLAKIFDAHYNPLEIDPLRVRWKIDGAVGIFKNGMFLSTNKEANGRITARLADTNLSDAILVNVLRPKTINVEPPIVLMRTGEMQKLDISAIAADGEYLYVTPEIVRVKVTEGLKWLPEKSKVVALKSGKQIFTTVVGGVEKKVPIYVDYFKSQVVEGFDKSAEVKLSYKNCGAKETNISTEEKNKKEGGASLRVNYKMLHGGISAVYLDINRPIPGRPYKLGFWVYGDGKEQWLRGFIADKDGEEFIADFTGGTKGVFWKDKWRFVEIDTDRMPPKWTNPAAKLDYPLTLKKLYLVQTREAKKSGGSILIDAFTALYPRQ